MDANDTINTAIERLKGKCFPVHGAILGED